MEKEYLNEKDKSEWIKLKFFMDIDDPASGSK
jgi:hypothetical protein